MLEEVLIHSVEKRRGGKKRVHGGSAERARKGVKSLLRVLRTVCLN